MLRFQLIITILLFTVSFNLFGQVDTAYYFSYKRQLTTRLYLSQKYTSLTLHNSKHDVRLMYRPNTTLNMGIGVTFHGATLNLAYGFPFLNPDTDHGKTRFLDLQFHSYRKNLILDVLAEFYKGFYLLPKGEGRPDQNYYIRPDIFVYELGVNVQHVFNHSAASHRAAMFQDEWQHKSAGSFVAGGEIYWGHVSADSTLTPSKVNKTAAAEDIRKLYFFQLGPNAGYMYTLVIKSHYYIFGSLSASLDFTANKSFSKDGADHQRGFSPNTFIRLGTGYNSAAWALSLVYINNGVNLATGGPATRATLNTGNIRLNLTHRFPLRKRLKRVVNRMLDF